MDNHARLVVEGRGNWVYTHAFGDSERITIGRGPNNDIDIGDLHASSAHAEILRKGNKYFIRDLGSRNGTMLSGDKLTDEIQLKSGADIRIGTTTMSFLNDSDDSFATTTFKGEAPSAGLQNPAETLNPIAQKLEGLQQNLQGSENPEESNALLSQAVEDLQYELHEAKETINRLRIVNEFVKEISDPDLSPLQLVSLAMSIMCKHVEGENGFIMQIDPKSKKWSVRARYGDIRDWETEHETTNRSLPMSLTLVEEALKTGQPVISQSAMDDPRFIEAKSIGLLGIQTCLCYPLFDGTKTGGVVYADRRNSPNPFSKDHEKLFHALTSQLNNFLYE